MIIKKIFLSITFIVLPIITAFIFRKNILKNNQSDILKLFFKLLLCTEMTRFFYVLLFQKLNIKTDLPFQLCYFFIILIFIEIIYHKDYLLDYIVISSIFFGSVSICLYPHTIDKFLIIIGYLYHSLMILLGVCFYLKKYKPKITNNLKITFILIIQLFMLYIINIMLDSNYGFIKIVFNPEKILIDPFLTFYYSPIPIVGSIHQCLLSLKKFFSFLYGSFIIALMYLNYFIIINMWNYFSNKKYNFF